MAETAHQSENAVANQIFIASIYYCLHLLIKIETKALAEWREGKEQ
jgi:hypothetical protein